MLRTFISRNLVWPFLLSAIVSTAGLLAAPATPVQTSFDGGESTTEVDGFPGKPGEGWASPWMLTPAGTPAKVTVTSASPLGDKTGPYLNVEFKAHTAGQTAMAVSREVDINVADVSKPYKISFSYRPDVAMEGPNDMWFMAGSSVGGSPGTGPRCTWMIRGSKTVWYLGNGDRKGGATWERSEMTCVPGKVYHFVVLVDPGTESWKVEVKTDEARIESATLGFRESRQDGGKFLYFGVATGETEVNAGFSFDSLSV
ncbi:MAG: hypothetical protein ACAI35_17395, partial [Candidatus Methylacidiphilales bacterium]|nr:hypothetical protein [Candidatus Methylacidiphilales bacterium]